MITFLFQIAWDLNLSTPWQQPEPFIYEHYLNMCTRPTVTIIELSSATGKILHSAQETLFNVFEKHISAFIPMQITFIVHTS